MDDFGTVQHALHYYGDTIPNDQEILQEGLFALDRIEREVEGLRLKWWAEHQEAERLRKRYDAAVSYSGAKAYEVERLRAQGIHDATELGFAAKEVERLRKLFHDTSGDRAVALADEVKRLRAEKLEKGGFDAMHISCTQEAERLRGELLEVHDKLAHADNEVERLRAGSEAAGKALYRAEQEVGRLREIEKAVRLLRPMMEGGGPELAMLDAALTRGGAAGGQQIVPGPDHYGDL